MLRAYLAQVSEGSHHDIEKRKLFLYVLPWTAGGLRIVFDKHTGIGLPREQHASVLCNLFCARHGFTPDAVNRFAKQTADFPSCVPSQSGNSLHTPWSNRFSCMHRYHWQRVSIARGATAASLAARRSTASAFRLECLALRHAGELADASRLSLPSLVRISLYPLFDVTDVCINVLHSFTTSEPSTSVCIVKNQCDTEQHSMITGWSCLSQ